MYDLLITGGLVVDGTGVPGRPADVGITDGRVEGIGRLRGSGARQTIDADGLVVAPGLLQRARYVPAELVTEIVEERVALSIGKDEFERLEEHEEPPFTKQIQPD